MNLIPDECWHPAIEADGELREGAWVAGATGMINLSAWPQGSRLILREERPHPGAQLTFADVDGHRSTAFLTDTGRGVSPGQLAGLGTAAPPARPRRGPHRAGEGSGPAEPALPGLG